MYVVLIIIDNIENCRIALKATLIHLLTYHLVVEISVPTGGDMGTIQQTVPNLYG